MNNGLFGCYEFHRICTKYQSLGAVEPLSGSGGVVLPSECLEIVHYVTSSENECFPDEGDSSSGKHLHDYLASPENMILYSYHTTLPSRN